MIRFGIAFTCITLVMLWFFWTPIIAQEKQASQEQSKMKGTASHPRVRKGYLVIEHEAIDSTNDDALKEYTPIAESLLKEYGGNFIVLPGRRGRSEALQGDWNPESFSIVEFPSYEHARNFYFSPEYQSVLPIRLGTYTDQTKELLIEGR